MGDGANDTGNVQMFAKAQVSFQQNLHLGKYSSRKTHVVIPPTSRPASQPALLPLAQSTELLVLHKSVAIE